METVSQKPRLLKDIAYDALKSQILAGELRAGAFLSERQLASELEMSKTPVREALERLQGERLVTVAPKQGYIVHACSLRELSEHFEFRLLLEPHFLRATARRMTTEIAEKLQSHVDKMSAAIAANDQDRAIKLDVEFHLLYAQFAGNQEMLRVMSQLCERMFRIIPQTFGADDGRMVRAQQEHLEIAHAVLSGDGDGAALLIVNHLEHCRETLLTHCGTHLSFQ